MRIWPDPQVSDPGFVIVKLGIRYLPSTHRGRQVQVAIVEDTVEISAGGEVLRVHAVKHDHSREHGAFANAGGRPSRINAA